MLIINEEFFGTEDIAEIKNWLKQPGAALFRKAIQNEILSTQVKASNDMATGIKPDMARFKVDAEQKLRRVNDLQVVVAELDRAASVDFKPYTAVIFNK
jgi:hypothetical protein